MDDSAFPIHAEADEEETGDLMKHVQLEMVEAEFGIALLDRVMCETLPDACD